MGWKTYWVYILAGESATLYIGVTNDLERRIREHKRKEVPGFTQRYSISRLVYFEKFGEIRDAIAREKQLKGWRRNKKIALIGKRNPGWCDLAEHWIGG